MLRGALGTSALAGFGLLAGGAAAAGTLSGCTSGSSGRSGAIGTGTAPGTGSSVSGPVPTVPAGGTGTPTGGAPVPTGAGGPTSGAPAWDRLRAGLHGRLLLPTDTGYDRARLSANPRYDGVRPAAVALCAGPDDVVAALRFARDGGVPFSVRSGGHSYPGWSTGTGLVIDTSAMSQVQVSPGPLLRVGAGTRLVDVYSAAAKAGFGLAAGSCPSVAVTGLTLGGGVGVMARAWGLTCDALVALELVTANGTLRTVSADAEPDLFWASRGGGGGSFGVVTSLTFRPTPAPDVSLLYLSWPWPRAAAVVAAWQAWAPVTDRRCWTTCKLLVRDGRPRVLVAGVWSGPAGGESGPLSALVAAVGSAPASRSVSRHPFLAAMLLEAGCRAGSGAAAGRGDTCHLPPVGSLAREPLAATSQVPVKPLAAQGITALVGLVDDVAADPALRAAGLVEAGVSLDALGGAVAETAPDATAFGHRGAPFTIQYTAIWRAVSGGGPVVAQGVSPSPAGVQSTTGAASTTGVQPTAGAQSSAGDPFAARAQSSAGDPFAARVRAMRAAMLPFAGNTGYVNYPDSDIVDWAQAYWGDNQWRLSRIKHAVDPDGLFTFPQAVQG